MEPMETAPKNGTHILLMTQFRFWVIGWNHFADDGRDEWESDRYLPDLQPLGWLPLPPVPDVTKPA